MQPSYRSITGIRILLLLTLLAFISACGGGGGGAGGGSTPPAPASTNANLSSLSVSVGSLSPAFTSLNTSYSVNGVTQPSIQITAILAEANASLRINGVAANSGSPGPLINLSIGSNVINVEVTAEDGVTQKVYQVTVNRTSQTASNANLSSLVINAGNLSPAFSSFVTSYSTQVSNAVSATTFTVTTSASLASIRINGIPVMSGVESILFNLVVGANVFDITVTSEDGQTVKTYTVSIQRAGVGGNADLGDLTLDGAVLNENFSPNQTLYTANVKFLTTSIRFLPVASDSKAVILIDNQVVVSGAQSPSVSLAEGQNNIDIRVTSGDGAVSKTYTVAVTRENVNQFGQTVFIKSDTGVSLNFGGNGGPFGTFSHGVAIDGDTMVIGVALDDRPDPSTLVSAIYIYERINGIWTFQQRFTDPLGLQFFGTSVDVDGDTIVVSQPSGVRGVAPNYVASGAVYVYTRNAGVWAFDQVIEPDALQPLQLFGASIDLEGDTLVVGSPQLAQDVSGIFSTAGGVYVFTRSGSGWTQQTIITPANIGIGDGFGAAVALYGNTLVISSPGEDSIATGVNGNENDDSTRDSGAAYIFIGSGSNWTQEAYLKSDVMTTQYARSLDVYADTVAISSVNENRVYVYTRANGQWSKQAVVQPNLTGYSYSPFFGASLDLYNDTLLVGAPHNSSAAGGINGDQTDTSALASGAAYVFARSNGNWAEQAFIKAAVPTFALSTSEGFGGTVELDGDTIAVVAPGHRSDATGILQFDPERFGTNLGAVYLFE